MSALCAEATLLNRGFEGVLKRPSVFKPRPQSIRSHFFSSCPLMQTSGLSLECQNTVTARVSSLLNLRCPAAISGLIVAVKVLAIDAVLCTGGRSHVGKKRLKTVIPARADRDPPASVTMPILVARIVAARLHVYPRAVFLASASLSRLPVRRGRATPRGKLSPQAPARFDVSLAQVAPQNLGLSSAIASAEPERVFWLAFGKTNNGQPLITLPGHVDHNLSSIKHLQTTG